MQTTQKFQNILLSAALGISLAYAGIVQAKGELADQQIEPVELLVKFNITGQFTGMTAGGLPIYTVGGPGFAAITTPSAEILDLALPRRMVATLDGAQITFAGAATDPIVAFTCLPGSCQITFTDGSVLVSDAGVPLEGRAINMWGPVMNPDYDPNGIYPTRILGCGGLKEIAGKGKLAGMVGSICFNGVLNFNVNDLSVLTGGSNCTITMHTPVPGISIP